MSALRQALFTLSDVQAQFEALMKRWFIRWGQLSAALDLVFGTQLGPETYLETRFLLLAQAAEAYSRLRFPDQQRQTKDHKERRRLIVASITNPKHKAWLKEALTYYHEPTFAEKLTGLLAHAGTQANAVIRADFAEVVKATRNYFTHYDATSARRAITAPAELQRLAEEVMLLLVFCLLRDLDFGELQSWEFLVRTRRCRAMLL